MDVSANVFAKAHSLTTFSVSLLPWSEKGIFLFAKIIFLNNYVLYIKLITNNYKVDKKCLPMMYLFSNILIVNIGEAVGTLFKYGDNNFLRNWGFTVKLIL
jgi:hypothetical protein